MRHSILVLILGLIPLTAFAQLEAPSVPQLPNIAEDTIYINTPKTFMGQDIEAWSLLGAALVQTAQKNIVLYITGVGGAGLSGQNFISLLQEAKATGHKIEMRVVGPAYSMHAFITCFASKLTITQGSFLMFHNGSVSVSLLHGLIKYQDASPDVDMIIMQNYWLKQCEQSKVLTPEDSKIIRNGGQVYIFVDEAGIPHSIQVKYDPDQNISLINQVIQLIVLLVLIFDGIFFLAWGIRRVTR